MTSCSSYGSVEPVRCPNGTLCSVPYLPPVFSPPGYSEITVFSGSVEKRTLCPCSAGMYCPLGQSGNCSNATLTLECPQVCPPLQLITCANDDRECPRRATTARYPLWWSLHCALITVPARSPAARMVTCRTARPPPLPILFAPLGSGVMTRIPLPAVGTVRIVPLAQVCGRFARRSITAPPQASGFSARRTITVLKVSSLVCSTNCVQLSHDNVLPFTGSVSPVKCGPLSRCVCQDGCAAPNNLSPVPILILLPVVLFVLWKVGTACQRRRQINRDKLVTVAAAANHVNAANAP